MTTTLTLEPDVEALLAKVMEERNFSFSQAVNFAIREGLGTASAQRRPFVQPTFDLGECSIAGTWNVQAVADTLYDGEIIRSMDRRK